ncbi:MAG: CAP domain-containing protein [Thermoguttaceae bacterium]
MNVTKKILGAIVVLAASVVMTPQRGIAAEGRPISERATSPGKLESANHEVDGVKLRAIEANIVSYTNQERAQYGLPPLKVDKELMETAREHAEWMTLSQNMVHTSQPVAENIAMGQPHSSDVVQAWMNSSGHRANILSGVYRTIGVAAFRTASGTIFWCQQFR